ncbi:MAG: 3-isopropylmalate dehydratase small subunit [Candidatus Methanosuratincola sp.]|jgi:3-isopropylmalate/(R)-2-methylmalate dehydratase small subunit|nr:3-isopropylmalate dehydratase small subunit [Candidatus Methanosuratincola sp.]
MATYSNRIMEVQGRAWLFGDDIDTDVILPGKYLVLTDPKELAKHALEGLVSGFSSKISEGDIIVAGKNFGCGSSREHAPLALKYAGVGAVVAKSFSRIFFRNAINIGLPVVISKEARDVIKEGERLSIDLEGGSITREDGSRLIVDKYPAFLLEILKDGGLLQNLKRRFGKEAKK